ncbi:hypothetical protein P7D73_21760 [Enterococcus raffinosus]|uniref:hypothetical protein n=1 Tax=Enterococcus raffinosus TaxID=71452 RepID=UPI0028906EA2|nr:hypothetical protein [Enterococcus raffinosus]MDT2525890.1 hypothetical protein [Enterococcus raffinosus]MDT2536398.1 hypothetical protein [Enterococcus raffinosus]MDT2593172.1 hypothetical protein [Enterococcus raffinosus]
MDIPEPPYSKELLASSKIIQEIVDSKLEIIRSHSTITEEVARIVGKNSALASTFLSKSPLMKSIEEQHRNIFKSIPQSVLDIHQGSSLSSTNISNQIANIIPKMDFSDIFQAYRFNNTDMSKYDFRIGVATQELEQVFTKEPEAVTETLLFEETSEPSNELEAQFFDILNQQRDVLNDSISLFEEINAAKNKDVTEKPSNEEHDSPAFYKDKMWYAEEIASNLLSLVISAIFAKTIGVDPTNTIGFVLLLGCLLRFIKPKL